MKILVPTKRVPDTDQKIKVSSDGTGVQTNTLPFIINPFDAIALEEALRIQEGASDEVEVITVGIGNDEYEKELRAGLAMGADRAIHVSTDELLDPWNVSKVLKVIVEKEAPDLVLMGKQAVDDDSNQAGQFLAAQLDWPQATFISKIELADSKANVERETDLGIEKLSLNLPAVITADLRLNEPRYASLPNIMKAKKKPIDSIPLTDLGIEIEPKIEIISVEAPSSIRSCKKVETVDELLTLLRDEAKVL